jgi:hypothetical protein
MRMIDLVRRVLRTPFVWIAALLILFEEWGWEPLARLVGKLARLPMFARLEQYVAALSPYAALVTYCVPALLMLSVKVTALYWISLGYSTLGVTTIVVAKIVGTAIVARLFQLTQPALLTLPWFARLYGRWSIWKATVVAVVRASAIWRAAGSASRRARQWWREWTVR